MEKIEKENHGDQIFYQKKEKDIKFMDYGKNQAESTGNTDKVYDLKIVSIHT